MLLPKLLWILLSNGLLFAGAFFLGWPVGNVLVLFWVENAIIGVFNLARMVTTIGGTPVSTIGFFIVHYGLFNIGHRIFAYQLGWELGFDPTFLAFSLPIAVIAFRYLMEFTTSWLPHQRHHYRHSLMLAPYGRLVTLHLSLLAVGLAPLFLGGDSPGATQRSIMYALATVLALKTAQEIIATLIDHYGQHDGPPLNQHTAGKTS